MAAWDLWRVEGAEEEMGLSDSEWDCPVPDAYAEPVMEMLQALAKGQALFAIQSGSLLPSETLTLEQVKCCIARLPLCLEEPRVWPLLEHTFLVAFSLDGAPDDPMNTVQIQSIRRLLVGQLNAMLSAPLPAPIGSILSLHKQAPSGNSKQEPETSLAPLPLLSLLASVPATAITVLPLAQLGQAASIEHNIAELNALLEVILKKQLHTQFQPIVNLRDGHILGYEALIRGPKNALIRRPGAMFRTADKAHIVAWFDLACQEHCFRVAAQQGLKQLLFVNMDAEGLAYCDHQERSLAQCARDHGLAPARIVVEVTERQTIGDFPRLLRYLSKLRDEGFKIAIDDAGAGYSSLNTIAEVRPDFVKLDRELVRNINRNGERRALLLALMHYTRRMGAALLAEGAETEEELATLIDLGVPFVQGYVLAKPADTLRGISKQMRAFIANRAHKREASHQGHSRTVGSLAVPGRTFPPDAPLADAAYAFAKNESLTSVVIVEDGCARGILMRSQLNHVLEIARAARVADYLPSETITQWMQTNALYAPAHAPATEIARQATARTDISLDTDVIVTEEGGQYLGTLAIRVLFEAAMAA